MESRYSLACDKETFEASAVLHDVFTPICDYVAEAASPDKLNPSLAETVNNITVSKLPYGQGYEDVPWDIARGRDLPDINLQNIDALDVLIDSENPNVKALLNWIVEYTDKKPTAWVQREYDPDNKRKSMEANIKRLALNLLRCINLKDKASRAKWKQYERAMEQLSDFQRKSIELYHETRETNISEWEENNPYCGPTPDMRRQDYFLHLRNNLVSENDLIKHLSVPIGEYGEDYARNLLQATAYMQGILSASDPKLIEGLIAGNQKVLKKYTARANDPDSKSLATPRTTENSAHEGILSIMQTISLVTQERVPGYADPEDLVRDLVEAGIIERIARLSAMGFVGPMTLSGRYFPESLKVTGEGIKLNGHLEQYLVDAHRKYIGGGAIAAANAQKKVQVDEDEIPTHTLLKRGCPVADKNGGIAKLAKSMGELIAA